MRGKRIYCQISSVRSRITPAGAGKTRSRRRGQVGAWDHPRRCGENMRGNCRYTRKTGSPPQVRGKRFVKRFPQKHPGITPAGAGKTILCRRVTVGYEDHPRRCGENMSSIDVPILFAGSPPQVRGKRPFCGLDTRFLGITPAGAGKTCVCTVRQADTEDHPRRCGENRGWSYCPIIKEGSPPQVRGKPADERLADA